MNKSEIDLSSVITTIVVLVFGMVLIFTCVAPFEKNIFLALGFEDASFFHYVYKILGSSIAFGLSILTAFGIAKLWKRLKKPD